MRLAQKAEVEQNVGARLPVRHALVLARLPFPDAQREVYGKVNSEHAEPKELNYQTYVEAWFRRHPQASRNGRPDRDGWTSGDLEEDGELASALETIEKVYGPKDRKAIQDGAIGLSRKDIIRLSAFHPSKMRELQYFIMVNHWDLARSLRFINAKPDAKTRIGELQNHCLATPGLYYTCSVDGFEIQIKASEALINQIKGQVDGRANEAPENPSLHTCSSQQDMSNA